jgi:hypothetical protein
MQRTSITHRVAHVDLRQHFQNYFEFLLGEERSKLQQIISDNSRQFSPSELLIEIDCRISYLRGAVKMGKLLCLISQEEAKAHFLILCAEREHLRAAAKGESKSTSQALERGSQSARFDAIHRSLRSGPKS